MLSCIEELLDIPEFGDSDSDGMASGGESLAHFPLKRALSSITAMHWMSSRECPTDDAMSALDAPRPLRACLNDDDFDRHTYHAGSDIVTTRARGLPTLDCWPPSPSVQPQRPSPHQQVHLLPQSQQNSDRPGREQESPLLTLRARAMYDHQPSITSYDLDERWASRPTAAANYSLPILDDNNSHNNRNDKEHHRTPNSNNDHGKEIEKENDYFEDEDNDEDDESVLFATPRPIVEKALPQSATRTLLSLMQRAQCKVVEIDGVLYDFSSDEVKVVPQAASPAAANWTVPIAPIPLPSSTVHALPRLQGDEWVSAGVKQQLQHEHRTQQTAASQPPPKRLKQLNLFDALHHPPPTYHQHHQ
jgi:hypothetical protein